MKVLFSVNLAESDEMIRQVEELCQKLEADLYVLHVDAPAQPAGVLLETPLADHSSPEYASFDPSIGGDQSPSRDMALRSFLHHGFRYPVQMMFRESADPAAMILSDIDRIGADILVMGRNNHSFLERMVVGSVSKKVVREARIPVLLIPSE